MTSDRVIEAIGSSQWARLAWSMASLASVEGGHREATKRGGIPSFVTPLWPGRSSMPKASCRV